MTIPRVFLSFLSSAGLLMPAGAAHAQPDDEESSRQRIAASAEAGRSRFAAMSFDEFVDTVKKEPFEGGKYIVNGDTVIGNEKLLREFFEKYVVIKPAAPDDEVPEFAVMSVGGLQAIWPSTRKRALTYCVSTNFGLRHQRVVVDMLAASAAWEAAADIDFIHLVNEDGNCNAQNGNVVFDVRPVQVFGMYLARAFFPNEPRPARNVLIDESSFQLDPSGNLSLPGILRHELGHVLGARHEHTRPEAGRCFEDSDWEPLTDYDALSVMHYPHCNGAGDWTLTLTLLDRNGVACLYGPAQGFAIDPAICDRRKSQVFRNQRVDPGAELRYGTLQVRPGTLFAAVLSGSGPSAGDPDLYVKFDGTPQVGLEYDCRPYLDGAEERCELDVPGGTNIARVMVHGYAKGQYDLSVSWVEPD